MKYPINFIPENAFLKITVSARQRRLYFKDVKTFKKVPKPHTPPIPAFHLAEDWGKSAITDCGSNYTQELALAHGNYWTW